MISLLVMTEKTSDVTTGLPVRPRIYELMVRHFGNTTTETKFDGALEENGCGKFADIDRTALQSLRDMGFTHVWLTGVLEQASGTDYPDRPADDADILKGQAGSPYAIKDYFDVCPDYAEVPSRRLVEFRKLLKRCEEIGLRALIDFVPNHVARSYESDVMPTLSFGKHDDTTRFFHRDNNFYYLSHIHPGGGPPLKLPAGDEMGCDGLFAPEAGIGRVTGNNAVTWAPSINDWYETVKLNYGHDYTTGRDTSHLPGPDADLDSVPDTWRKMDAVLEFWQQMGVGGFRVDMAHMIPMEFWRWVIPRVRDRESGAFFMAEAYDGDPAKLTDEDVVGELLKSGFDGVYDGPLYERLQEIYEGPKWANDIDEMVWSMDRLHSMVRYAENHDEVRIANPQHWGGGGANVGRAVSAIVFGIGGGPVMVYNGQEVGEPAIGAEGFSGDDGRSSIFDYGVLPRLAKWVNGKKFDGGQLTTAEFELREWYGRLVRLCGEPALERGWFYGLNHANMENRDFGRLALDKTSGHWLYAFLRSERRPSGQTFLVVVNLNTTKAMSGVRVRIPEHAMQWLSLRQETVTFRDRLAEEWEAEAERSELPVEGLALPAMAPCSAMFLELG